MFKGIKINKVKYIILLALVLLVTFASNMWVITFMNGFAFDDYALLKIAKFNPFNEILHLLPYSRYNDRPVGLTVLKVLYMSFGLNDSLHHLVLLGIHIFNTFLLFVLSIKLVEDLDIKKYRYICFLSSLIFGLWPKSIMCIQWDSSIYDLLGATILLLIFNLHLSKKYLKFNALLMILLYYLALRTKEITIVAPVIIIFYEFAKYLSNTKVVKIKDFINKLNWNIYLMVFLMFFYFVIINSLDKGITQDINNPYYYTFSPIILVRNILRYVALYFDYTTFDFSFHIYTIMGYLCVAVFFIIFLLAIFLNVKKRKFYLLAIYFCIFLSLAPVLPMKNMQHILYLYIPSIYMSLLISSMINYFLLKGKSLKLLIIANILCSILLVSIRYVPSVVAFRNYWSNVCQNNRISLNDLSRIKKPYAGSKIYVTNYNNNYNIFFYGPGAVNNIVFNDQAVNTYINSKPNKKDKHFIIIKYYSDGHVKEIARK